MILVVGASGRLGSIVVQRLLAEGKLVRALTRNPPGLAFLEQQGVEVMKGDLRDPESLTRACQGVEQVVLAAHALVGKGDNNPHMVDDAGNRHLIEAAKMANVKHIVFISVQGANLDSPIEFFRIKYSIEEYLQASGLNYTILRPVAFMELWAELVGQPVLEKGKTTIFGRGNNPINFVSVEDVACFVCHALTDAHMQNAVIEVGGPQNLTMNQVAAMFEQVGRRRAKKRYIPLPMMRVMSLLMQFINPPLSRQMQTAIYMDTANLRYNGSETARTFGIALTPFEEIARRAARVELSGVKS